MTPKQLIKQYKGKVVPFKYLPVEFQLAMIYYMAIDGEAWKIPEDDKAKGKFPSGRIGSTKLQKNIAEWVKKNLAYWIKNYGKKKFGMLYVPMADFCKVALDSWNKMEHRKENQLETFEDLHKQYLNGACGFSKAGLKKHYTKKWPAIINSTDPEVSGHEDILEDGCHRFHAYVARKVKVMPLIYYP